MRALTVVPRVAGSATLEHVVEPVAGSDELLVQTLEIGVCGTDREILDGHYGSAPAGDERLILGHECLGRVLRAAPGSEFQVGDLVAPFVRHPDPLPCASCAAGEWDMCENGQFTEHGIRDLHGFAAERRAVNAAFAVRVPEALRSFGVLVEPASVVAKAWEQIERISARYGAYRPRRVLVTGAGPIGLLAALIGVLRGYEVHVFDRANSGPKPALVLDLGATYHSGSVTDMSSRPDIVIECTGAPPLVAAALSQNRRNGIVCLTGISSGSRPLALGISELNDTLVLENDVVFGSVNANRRHYIAAVEALSAGRASWLERMISRRVPLDSWEQAFVPAADDVKVVIDFEDSRAANSAPS